jgi:hypothetical protein
VGTNEKPYTIGPEEDGPDGNCMVRVGIQEPHVWVFLIAGDVFNCLRAALDHAVWRIASLHVAQSNEGIQFPIIRANDKDGMRLFQKQTTGLPEEAIAVIESFQPYNRPPEIPLSNHLLWCLGKMTNIDKHRRIPVHPTLPWVAPDVQPVSVTGEDRKTYIFSVPKPLNDRTLRIEVIFGSEVDGVALGLADIHNIYDLVANHILVRLARFDP